MNNYTPVDLAQACNVGRLFIGGVFSTLVSG